MIEKKERSETVKERKKGAHIPTVGGVGYLYLFGMHVLQQPYQFGYFAKESAWGFVTKKCNVAAVFY